MAVPIAPTRKARPCVSEIITPIDTMNTCFIKSKSNEKEYKKLSDLEEECLIMPIERSSLRKNLSKVLESANVELNPQFEYATEELIVESTKKNLGIGYVVDGQTVEVEKDTLEKINLKEKLPTIEINLVYIENYITELARSFINEELISESEKR